jgi:hypothetical protein
VSAESDTAPVGEELRRAESIGILNAWWTGWQAAFDMPGILVLKWLVNLIFAAAAILPTALLLAEYMGHSVVGEQAFTRMGTDIAVEFALANRARLLLAALACAPIALAYLLVNLYLTGGILHRLRAGVREPWGEFFASCHQNFWMLVRVGLFTLALAAALLGLSHWGLARLVEKLTVDAAGPQPLFFLTGLHWVILFLLGSWVARVYDYARIAVFLQPASKARTAVVRAVAFTLRRGTKTLVLWLLLVLPALSLTAVFATAPTAGGVETMTGIWVSAGLGQALLLLRFAGSFAALGGQMRFMAGTRLP